MGIPKALQKDQAAANAYLRARQDVLVGLYVEAERRLLRQLHDPSITSTQRSRVQALLAQIDRELRRLDKRAPDLARDNVGASYVWGVTAAAAALGIAAVYTSKVNTSTVSVLTSQMATDLLTMNSSLRQNARRFAMTSQQKAIADAALFGSALEGAVGGTPTSGLLKSLQQAIAEGKLITIKGRNYNPAAYAEMLVRTRRSEAFSQAVINTSIQAGSDLVQVAPRTHEGNDSICPLYIGKVFSISGKSRYFPKMGAVPPFHPNCKDTLVPVQEKDIDRRGQLSSLSKLSKSGKPVESMKDYREALK